MTRDPKGRFTSSWQATADHLDRKIASITAHLKRVYAILFVLSIGFATLAGGFVVMVMR